MKKSIRLTKEKKLLSQKKIIPKNKLVKNDSFPVVAIGASAGGLKAVSLLLKNLPADTGMAFIYVQHLNPDHKSALPALLSKTTKMKVQEIEDMEHMEPNNVYVIPSNKIIKVTDGHIKLFPRPKNSSVISIDVLFSSLASTHKSNVIGVILSGYAKDGMLGLKAIKLAGGITFAQDETAQVNSMPKSAINSGVVDYILSPKEIAHEIVRISISGILTHTLKPKISKIETINSVLESIFELLYKETGIDFSQYKMPTIKRRLNHRMVQNGIKTQKEYLKLLSNKGNEIKLLCKDLLINVTDFFRDSETFKYLKANLLPKLLKGKTKKETIRIWVPACSTGQEAYSIAMLITELQENKTLKVPVQIFATDLSKEVILKGRVGEYTQGEIKSVSKKLLDKFFTKMGNKYLISKEIREMCVFAPHNILKDPPFSHMDFISCRNLLIYFNSNTQKKVFNTLHFALSDHGMLLLGNAETIGTPSTQFIKNNSKFKIYSKRNDSKKQKILELTSHFPNINSLAKKTLPILKTRSSLGFENAIDSYLLSDQMPACAIINKELEVLQFRGSVSLYLTHPSGRASLNILKISRPEFAFELRSLITKALETNQKVYRSGIEIQSGKSIQIITLEVSPLKIEWDEPLLLIVYREQGIVENVLDNTSLKIGSSSLKDRKIKKLTEELESTRAEMKIIFETQEDTYEELQAANEEIVSSNEEFQTLNEELETSKEEIQASNEELMFSNSELQIRNDLLTESQEYSEAIFTTIHEPMLILNVDITVKSANRAYYKKFATSESETEKRSLFELDVKQWQNPQLKKLLNEVLKNNSTFENFEVNYVSPIMGDRIMLLNGQSFTDKARSKKLILLAIADITETRKLALELQKKESSKELNTVNAKLAFQLVEKDKRSEELVIANTELIYQRGEKEKRAAELVIANIELIFQNSEKEKRAAELNNAKYARNLIEVSLDPLVTIDVNGKVTDVNEASVKVTGIKRENLIGTNFSDYFTDPEKAQSGYQKVFEEGFVADYPLTIKHKNGNYTDVLYNASVYKDENGHVIGVFAAARDVTEQKMIEANLEKSLREVSDYKHALDEFSIVAITDEKGIIKHANDNFCLISKYTRKELIGKDHRLINSGYHPKEFIREMWETISNGKIWRGELKNKAKDGTVYWVATTIVPFLNEQGRPYQYVAVRTDITDQKRNAAELYEAKLFAELATEFAEEAKIKAENATRIAEDAMRSKQQFLANMSHEIRTPMNAIIGFTKVVLKTDLSEKQKEYISAIKVSGDNLIVLINDILDLAKVDAGKMTFEKTPFKIQASVNYMLQLFEPKIKEKNLTFLNEFDSKIPEIVIGDSARLHQIILNLISNAIKFTTVGKISLKVNLIDEDDENVTIEFAVSDTGIGIDEKNIDNVFENFQQATSSTARLYGGTGLGLAIVKQLVEAQGGAINLKSKLGIGSTFSFKLNFKKTNMNAEIDQPNLEINTEIKNIKVLVAEDIMLNQLLMKTLLDDFGFERDVVSNGKLAIEKLQTKSYDIILMDLQMPEMNGFEATEYIRKILRSKIPIIALTADVTTVDVEKCKAIGMNDYLAKPIDEKILYDKIIQLVLKQTS